MRDIVTPHQSTRGCARRRLRPNHSLSHADDTVSSRRPAQSTKPPASSQ